MIVIDWDLNFSDEILTYERYGMKDLTVITIVVYLRLH